MAFAEEGFPWFGLVATAAAAGAVGDDDVCAFAGEVLASEALLPSFLRGALFGALGGVEVGASAVEEGLHFFLAGALFDFLDAGEAGFEGEEAGLEADGDVSVFVGGGGDDAEGEDGGGVF